MFTKIVLLFSPTNKMYEQRFKDVILLDGLCFNFHNFMWFRVMLIKKCNTAYNYYKYAYNI